MDLIKGGHIGMHLTKEQNTTILEWLTGYKGE